MGHLGWDAALGTLAAATGSKSGELIGLGKAPFQIITEISAEEMVGFTAARGHDPLVSSRVRVGMRAPTLALLDEADFDTDGDCRRNPDYGDTIRKLDIPFAQLAIIQRSPEVTLGLTMLRTARAGAMPADHKRLMEAAAPHVAAAVRLHMAAEGRAIELTAAGFEQTDQAALVLDRAGRLRAWSAGADALLRAGDLRLKAGMLSGRDSSDNSLSRAIDAARRVRSVADAPPGTALTRNSDGLVYPLEIMPLPSRHGFDFEAGVVVLARPPRQVEQRAAHIAGMVFGLTRAEAAVAGLLTTGLSASEIAHRQGVGVGTIRTHIRRLFEKTGSRNQLALIAAVTSRL
ncbi:MAG: helix-turn-helix transcriptional regulator [Pseudomonadota bacterium]